VQVLKETVACKLNLEMSMEEEIVRIAEGIEPQQVTLVPERRAELTTEGGLDCVRTAEQLKEVVRRMHKRGILVSAFITPEKEQITAAARFGCDAIELHTGQYANAETEKDVRLQLKRLEAARDLGLKKGMIVHAGHGLTYRNIGPIAAMNDLSELNIGHSIIARSMFVGIRKATAEMIRLIEKHAPRSR
jgi:pyridoxine 5-phosphate synthase